MSKIILTYIVFIGANYTATKSKTIARLVPNNNNMTHKAIVQKLLQLLLLFMIKLIFVRIECGVVHC